MSSRATARLLPRLLARPTRTTSRLRLHAPAPRPPPTTTTTTLVRSAHSIPRPPPPPPPRLDPQSHPKTPKATTTTTTAGQTGEAASEGPRPATSNPAYYQLSFTCVPCGHRSHHNVSKQGYHTGSTLITCPSCRNRHVMSDHLGIFGDRKITVEDLMRERGRLVKRGRLGEDGDIEFWPDDDGDGHGDAAGSSLRHDKTKDVK